MAMQKRFRMLWIALLAAGGAMLGSGVLLTCGLGRVNVQDRLARHSAATIASLPTAAAVGTLESLPVEAPWALAVWCEALRDPRREVRLQAAAQVERTYDRWRHLPLADASPRMAQLAACLANAAPHLPPEQRLWVKRMAQRLLEQPLDITTTDAATLIAQCQAILLLPDEPLATEPPTPLASPAQSPPAKPPTAKPLANSPPPRVNNDPVHPSPSGPDTSSLPKPPAVFSAPTDARPSPGPPMDDDAASAAQRLAEPRPLVDATARPLQPFSPRQRLAVPRGVPQPR
jgi:hypothetical protein